MTSFVAKRQESPFIISFESHLIPHSIRRIHSSSTASSPANWSIHQPLALSKTFNYLSIRDTEGDGSMWTHGQPNLSIWNGNYSWLLWKTEKQRGQGHIEPTNSKTKKKNSIREESKEDKWPTISHTYDDNHWTIFELMGERGNGCLPRAPIRIQILFGQSTVMKI